MKLIFILCLFTSLAFTKTIIDSYKNIKYLVLHNSMKVYLLSNKKAVNTKLTIEVKMGTSIEDNNNAGITHLLEHLIFRDSTIKYNDYTDYLRKEGAIKVNGFTKQYTSEYVAVIHSSKTKFLLKSFSNMLFKKDLKVERKALQAEIGELKWYHKPLYLLSKLKLFVAPEYNIFEDDFSLAKKKKRPNSYFYKLNNSKFTLKEIMKYYDEYYYPSNMILKIVGNFDDEDIKDYIPKHYGQINKKGSKTTKEPLSNARLNQKKSHTYLMMPNNNRAYIGAKYILDSYKKYQIIMAYTENLANRMQDELRNNLGQTYSVQDFDYGYRNAEVSGVSVDSINKNFDNNIKLIKEQIKKDALKIDDEIIKNAIDEYGVYYTSLENNNESLYELIQSVYYINKTYNIYDKTPYQIYKSIKASEFQKVINEVFKDENEYLYIYRDYYLFPYEMIL